MSEAKPCVLKLFNQCHVVERGRIDLEFGSLEWLQLICSICIKAVYARRFKSARIKYSVVSTL
jgi:hypothetical protein